MAFTLTVNSKLPPKTLTYPVLREYCGIYPPSPEKGKLIVLFLEEDQGIPLSGVETSRIGKLEPWYEATNGTVWAPCSITITSE